MLIICITGCIAGGLFLLAFLFLVIFAIVERPGPDGEYISITAGCIILGAIFLSLGIYNGVVGNQEYDKVTQVYSLQASDRFILGVGNGKYYYNLNDTDVQSYIESVPTSDTTLIQDDSIEHPYLLNHKVKWEDNEYFLYVPANVRIIQYSIK